jgi:hypothetical protein
MPSLVEEHRVRAELAKQRAAFERDRGDEQAARRHEVIAIAYERSARMLANEPLVRATPRQL